MKSYAKLVAASILVVGMPSVALAQYLCPDGNYVSRGPCTICPNGKYVGGGAQCQIAPDGSYVPRQESNSKGTTSNSSPPQITPNGRYVQGGAGMTICPDGSYVAGTSCVIAPNGKYVGR